MLIAPCSHKELKGDFVTCEGLDEDIVRVLGDSKDRTGQVKFSADGKWMVTGGFGTSVKLWNVAESPIRMEREFKGTIAWPNAFAISSESKTVAAGIGQTRGEIKLFDSTSGALMATLGLGDVEHGTIVAIAFNPSNSRMLAASTSDGNIFVWDDWSDAGRAHSPIKLENARGTAFQIAFSRDGGLLVGASDDGVLRMWAAKDGETDTRWRQIGPLRGHKGPVWAIAVSPDGDRIASGSTDGSIISWNTRSVFHPDEAHGGSIDGASVGASSKQDLTSCSDGLKLPRDFGTPAACARSPHGRIVVASSDGRVEVFDGDADAVVAVDNYRAAPDVAELTLDGDHLIVRSHSGSRNEWPFFDSLDALMSYSLAHLPYERAAQVALPKEFLCRINDQTGGCESEP